MRWKKAGVLFIAVCLAVDCFPHFGPPNFRYTGADPAHHVWNVGWPIAIAIYDQRSGWHMGPINIVLIPMQAVACVVVTIVVAMTSRTRRARTGVRSLPRDASDAEILAAVDHWVALLEAEDYRAAFNAIGHDRATGWTPDLIRVAITQYGEAKPGQKVTVNGKPTDISQRKSVSRFAKNRHGFVGYVWYDLNIDGFASDLTATFDLRVDRDGLTLVLDDIHVM